MTGCRCSRTVPPIKWAVVDPTAWAGGLVSPAYPGDAGYDMIVSRTVTVPASGLGMVPTNIKVELPEGHWAMIVGRSSTFMKRQLLVQTAIIDNGYRGELWCMVRNLTDSPVVVRKEERVCQMILYPLVVPPIEMVDAIAEATRGERGFGSTGTVGSK